MISKETKIRILENFVSLDYLFFGKSIHEMGLDNDIAKQYLELKGTLSSVMIEMYNTMDHNPSEITKILSESDIEKMAINAAIVARSNVGNILSSTDGKNDIVESVFTQIREDEEININETVNNSIQSKAFQLGMDNLLIARSLSESKNVDILNTFEGRILEDTYKSLRDSLVETALYILEINK